MTIPQFTAGQVLTAAQLNAMVDEINAGGGKMEVTAFTASGTFTVPAGVTYAVAHITGGGGGSGFSGGGDGGNSSVAFASGTITATGGAKHISAGVTNNNTSGAAGTVNSGQGGQQAGSYSGSLDFTLTVTGASGAIIVAGAVVTPAASITVTIGAGGAAGGGGFAGGSGYVWIEYVK